MKLFFATLCLTFIAMCNSGNQPPTTIELPGTSWQLESYTPANGTVTAAATSKKALLNFDASTPQLGGDTGCNGFGGEYTYEDGVITALLMSTKMYCQESAQQEGMIFNVFSEGATVSLKDGKLMLTAKSGELVYVKTTPATAEATPAISVEAQANVIAVEEAATADAAPTDGAEKSDGANTFTGLFRYMADAAIFTTCADNKRYSVLLEAAFADCEKSYQGMEKSGAPAFMVVEGEVIKNESTEGHREKLRITKLVSANSTDKCPG